MPASLSKFVIGGQGLHAARGAVEVSGLLLVQFVVGRGCRLA
jgi:hypothetical protein